MSRLSKLLGRDDPAVTVANGVKTAIVKNPAPGTVQIHASAGGNDFALTVRYQTDGLTA